MLLDTPCHPSEIPRPLHPLPLDLEDHAGVGHPLQRPARLDDAHAGRALGAVVVDDDLHGLVLGGVACDGDDGARGDGAADVGHHGPGLAVDGDGAGGAGGGASAVGGAGSSARWQPAASVAISGQPQKDRVGVMAVLRSGPQPTATLPVGIPPAGYSADPL